MIQKAGLTSSVTPDKIGKIINALMDGMAAKTIAFKNSVSREDVYRLKKEYSLFCGWTNQYGVKDD